MDDATAKVLEFIQRRFKIDAKWCSGNCYYFALILHDRFQPSEIFYDVIDGHFVVRYQGKYYDWRGLYETDQKLVSWNKFDDYDKIQKIRITRDCLE